MSNFHPFDPWETLSMIISQQQLLEADNYRIRAQVVEQEKQLHTLYLVVEKLRQQVNTLKGPND
jgi:hypothetical protein